MPKGRIRASSRSAAKADDLSISRIRKVATECCPFQSFAELTTVSLACQFLRRGRRADARQLLLSYLHCHPSTSRVAAALRLAC